jgi:hypothetical protein
MICSFDYDSKTFPFSALSRGSRKEQAVILKPIQREFKKILLKSYFQNPNLSPPAYRQAGFPSPPERLCRT